MVHPASGEARERLTVGERVRRTVAYSFPAGDNDSKMLSEIE